MVFVWIRIRCRKVRRDGCLHLCRLCLISLVKSVSPLGDFRVYTLLCRACDDWGLVLQPRRVITLNIARSIRCVFKPSLLLLLEDEAALLGSVQALRSLIANTVTSLTKSLLHLDCTVFGTWQLIVVHLQLDSFSEGGKLRQSTVALILRWPQLHKFILPTTSMACGGYSRRRNGARHNHRFVIYRGSHHRLLILQLWVHECWSLRVLFVFDLSLAYVFIGLLEHCRLGFLYNFIIGRAWVHEQVWVARRWWCQGLDVCVEELIIDHLSVRCIICSIWLFRAFKS